MSKRGTGTIDVLYGINAVTEAIGRRPMEHVLVAEGQYGGRIQEIIEADVAIYSYLDDKPLTLGGSDKIVRMVTSYSDEATNGPNSTNYPGGELGWVMGRGVGKAAAFWSIVSVPVGSV